MQITNTTFVNSSYSGQECFSLSTCEMEDYVSEVTLWVLPENFQTNQICICGQIHMDRILEWIMTSASCIQSCVHIPPPMTEYKETFLESKALWLLRNSKKTPTTQDPSTKTLFQITFKTILFTIINCWVTNLQYL